MKFRNKHETRFLCFAEGDAPADGAPLGNSPDARNPDGSLKDPAAKPPEGEKKSEGDKAPAWKEYTPDPAKSAEENAAAKAEHDKTKPAEGAPEKYDFKVPEGQKLDEKMIERVTPIFKKHGLTNEAAQELINAHNDAIKSITDGLAEQHKTTREAWAKEIANDPALGNGKDNFKPEVGAIIGRAMADMPNADKFKAAMDLTGAGDNPDFVRGFLHLAKLATEGRPVKPGGPAADGKVPGAAKTPASTMYPNLPSSS